MNYICSLTSNKIAFGWLDLKANNVNCVQFLEMKFISGYLFGPFVFGMFTSHNLLSLLINFLFEISWCFTLNFSVPGCQFVQYYIFCLYLGLASVKDNPLMTL